MQAIMGSTEALQEELWQVAGQFGIESSYTKEKIHRFPASLRGLGDRYIVPMVVAIGPYHHGLPHVQEMEKVKRMVCLYFITGSDHLSEKIYGEVFSVTGNARRLYADDAVAGISDADFAARMFRDALFLLQYLLGHSCSGDAQEPSFQHFFFSNRACIDNDIMLLENQLPWPVVEILMNNLSVDVDKFIAAPMIGRMSETPLVLGDRDSQPHLLGLILSSVASQLLPSPEATHVSVSSAIELAEIGIKLTASKTAKFMDMGFREGLVFAHIFLAPLSLDVLMASSLVNMAAFEVCTGSTVTRPQIANLQDAGEKKTDVCSYIRLLAMLMDREEDVHELRTKRLVNGDLTNKQTLDFFKGLTEHLYGGPRYVQLLAKIEDYKYRRWMRIWLHKFVYNNSKTIITVFTVVDRRSCGHLQGPPLSQSTSAVSFLFNVG